MSDIKIGDRVTGIKGNTRVTGTVMNIKEGHVHIKAPVSGVYAPLVSIVPLHKVTKLGEGAMKRKAEAEDDAGMSDYMHHVQTSSAPFDDAKPAKPHQDQFGNKIKIGNVAKNLAKQGMRGVKKEEVEQIDEVGPQKRLKRVFNKLRDARAGAAYKQSGMPVPEREPGHKNTVDHNKALGRALRKMSEDLHSRKVYEPTSAQELNPGLRAKIDAASNAQKPRPLSGMRPIGKIKLMTRKEEVELDEDDLSVRTLYNKYTDNQSAGKSNKPVEKAITKVHGSKVMSRLKLAAKASLKGNTDSEDNHFEKARTLAGGSDRIGSTVGRNRSAFRKSMGEEVEQVEEGYKGRRAFGSAYDKTHDPFQDSKRRFKSRELEHELAHEAPSGPAHHDQTPHDVHIDGKKWKTFGSAGHAHNVANKLSISGKRASVHKTPIAEKAPPGWEGTVKAMKKHSEIDNPFALAWWMKRKGAKSHKDEK